MPDWTEIQSSILGAWRLFVLNEDGMNRFNTTVDGFWRSFFAAVLLAPVALFAGTVQRDMRIEAESLVAIGGPTSAAPTVPELGPFLFVQMTAFGFSWVIFPLVMIGVTRLLSVTGRYAPFVVAFNWSNVIVALINLPPILLYGLGLISIEAAIAPALLIIFIATGYRWFIARVALGVAPMAAFAVALISILIELILAGLAGAILA
jgi:hypothetical protein